MHLGVLTLNAVGGVGPAELARDLEARGYESMWAPEHSHIPSTPERYPGGGDVPEVAARLREPTVSLAAAATATSSLRIGTGIALALQHDVLVLASTLASLHELSDGRLLYGVGAGWHRGELASHRPDVAFGARYAALRERITALRAAWEQPGLGFEGDWDRFGPCRRAPVLAAGALPVLVGATGPIGTRLAATVADGWCPVDVALAPDGSLAPAIDRFRHAVEQAGRDPDAVPITVFSWRRPSAPRFAELRDLGIARLVLRSAEQERDPSIDLRPVLDRWDVVRREFDA